MSALQRQKRKTRLYNYQYKKAAKLIKKYAKVCHICKKKFTNRKHVTADHILTGNVNSPLLPAHRSCNSRRGVAHYLKGKINK